MKICSKCNKQKTLTCFHKDKYKKDGFSVKCKSCVLQYIKINKEKLKIARKTKKKKKFHKKEGHKFCTTCQEYKLFNCYYVDKYTSDGLRSKCKDCFKKYVDNNKDKICEYRKARKDKIRAANKIIPESKYCAKCNKNKKSKLFSKCATRTDGLSLTCKSCTNNYYKKYCLINKERLKETNRLKAQKYRDKNRELTRIKDKIYCKKKAKKRKEIPELKIRHNVSNSIRKLMLSSGNKKNSSVLKYLPYTIKELKQHLESQFEPWMNWSNYGSYKVGGPQKWHIDHIIPQSRLPYDSMDHPNFKKCWALNNLRPLNAILNIKKGNKVE